jgi:intergrase/recombinase
LLNKAVNWSFFADSLKSKCSERVIRDRVRYAKKYQHCLFERNFSDLNNVSEDKQKLILKGLSALSKFVGLYQEFKGLMKAYGLTWASGKAEDLLISRMNKISTLGNVLNWIKKVEAKNPRLKPLINFMLISGLRFEEALRSYNLIIELSNEKKLDNYYEIENEMLQHYHFKTYFIRRTKKAFVSFVPKNIISEIRESQKLTKSMIYCKLKRQGFNMRFSDIREYYATFMTKVLNPAEIDFLQGRVNTTVFMKNYFNPALIKDLKHRVFQGINEMQETLSRRNTNLSKD